MSKKIVWPESNIVKPLNKLRGSSSTYGSYQEFVQKAQKIQEEQQAAQMYLQKAMPAMLKLLEIRLTNKEPITVMRPLRYTTSDFSKSSSDMDEIDRAFYNRRDDDGGDPGSFIEKVVTVNPGTQLTLKSLDMGLNEFIFTDAVGKEHCISFDEKNNLMTQTDIFETVKQLLKLKETRNE